MSFRYDFDMFFAEAENAQQDLAAQFAKADAHAKATDYVARFRDPALVKALRNAGDDVIDFFLSSGFELDVYDSGAPSGRYPADHEAARTYCIERMTGTFRTLSKNPERNWNGFDMVAFTQSIVKATPIEIAPRPMRPPEAEIVAQEELIDARHQREKRNYKVPRLERLVAFLMLGIGTALLLVSVVGAVA